MIRYYTRYTWKKQIRNELPEPCTCDHSYCCRCIQKCRFQCTSCATPCISISLSLSSCFWLLLDNFESSFYRFMSSFRHIVDTVSPQSVSIWHFDQAKGSPMKHSSSSNVSGFPHNSCLYYQTLCLLCYKDMPQPIIYMYNLIRSFTSAQ